MSYRLNGNAFLPLFDYLSFIDFDLATGSTSSVFILNYFAI